MPQSISRPLISPESLTVRRFLTLLTKDTTSVENVRVRPMKDIPTVCFFIVTANMNWIMSANPPIVRFIRVLSCSSTNFFSSNKGPIIDSYSLSITFETYLETSRSAELMRTTTSRTMAKILVSGSKSGSTAFMSSFHPSLKMLLLAM